LLLADNYPNIYPMLPMEYPKVQQENKAINIKNTLSLRFYGTISPYPIVDIVMILQ